LVSASQVDRITGAGVSLLCQLQQYFLAGDIVCGTVHVQGSLFESQELKKKKRKKGKKLLFTA
jgi:hypothetical protein